MTILIKDKKRSYINNYTKYHARFIVYRLEAFIANDCYNHIEPISLRRYIAIEATVSEGQFIEFNKTHFNNVRKLNFQFKFETHVYVDNHNFFKI